MELRHLRGTSGSRPYLRSLLDLRWWTAISVMVPAKVVETAISRFGSIDALVNNAGIFFTKAFTDYAAEAFKALSSTNLEGFLYVIIGTEAVTPAINIPINF